MLSAQLGGVGGQLGLNLSQDVHLRKVEGKTKVIRVQPESFPILRVKESLCTEQQSHLHVLWTHCAILHWLLARLLACAPKLAISEASAEMVLSYQMHYHEGSSA